MNDGETAAGTRAGGTGEGGGAATAAVVTWPPNAGATGLFTPIAMPGEGPALPGGEGELAPSPVADRFGRLGGAAGGGKAPRLPGAREC